MKSIGCMWSKIQAKSFCPQYLKERELCSDAETVTANIYVYMEEILHNLTATEKNFQSNRLISIRPMYCVEKIFHHRDTCRGMNETVIKKIV